MGSVSGGLTDRPALPPPAPEKFGFRASAIEPMTLMITVEEALKNLGLNNRRFRHHSSSASGAVATCSATSGARSRLWPAHGRHHAHQHKRRARCRTRNARRRLRRRIELSSTIERLPMVQAGGMHGRRWRNCSAGTTSTGRAALAADRERRSLRRREKTRRFSPRRAPRAAARFSPGPRRAARRAALHPRRQTGPFPRLSPRRSPPPTALCGPAARRSSLRRFPHR
jgi:hypothetical protein